MKHLLLLVLFFLTLICQAAPVWLYPNQNYAFYVSSTKILRYVEVEWNDMGGNARGNLYINGNSYGGYDVGNGMIYGNQVVPDLDVWSNINVFANTGYINIQNDSCLIYALRVLYWNNVDLTASPWYYNGWSMSINIDKTKIVRYIEVDWRNNGFYTYGALWANGYNYGSLSVDQGSYLFSNVYIPDTDRWYINNYIAANPTIIFTGGAAQIFAVRVVYADNGNLPVYPYTMVPPGPFPFPNNTSYPVPAPGAQPTGGPHIAPMRK